MISVNRARLIAGSFTFPFFGTWSADVDLDATQTLPEAGLAVSVTLGNRTLRGTVVRQAVYAGMLKARLVGGAAGWRSAVPARGYAHDAGVKLSSVLTDAARDCGETIALDADRTLGPNYVRDAGKAETVLSNELGGAWWVDDEGITRTSARAGTAIVTPFTIIGRSGSRGSFEIASDDLASWVPGRTFSNLTVPEVQTISSVTVDATVDGKTRLHVWTRDGAAGVLDRLRDDLRSLIRAELASLMYAGEWEYIIAATSGNTVDVLPTDGRMPAITKVPMRPGLMGEGVTPTVGSTCRVQFVNQNGARPEVVGIVGDPTEIAVGASPETLARGPASEDVRDALQTWFVAFTSGLSGAADISALKTAMATPNTVATQAITAAAADLQTTVLKGT